MDINNNYITDHCIVDFIEADDEAYNILCATSFAYQGRALASNWEVVPMKKRWWGFWIKDSGMCLRNRTGAAFLFPNRQCVDLWLKELVQYFPGAVAESAAQS